MEAVNQNGEVLKAYRKIKSPDDTELGQKEEEQKRWQSLFGNGGFFGLVNGFKTFYPNGVFADLARIDEIVLERTSDRWITVSEKITEEKEVLKSKRKKYLETFLEQRGLDKED